MDDGRPCAAVGARRRFISFRAGSGAPEPRRRRGRRPASSQLLEPEQKLRFGGGERKFLKKENEEKPVLVLY